jgi:hypothetical protein
MPALCSCCRQNKHMTARPKSRRAVKHKAGFFVRRERPELRQKLAVFNQLVGKLDQQVLSLDDVRN